MDKSKFLSAFTVPSEEYSLPNGESVTLKGLTVGQRDKWLKAYEDNPSRGPVMLVVLGCDILSEDDEKDITDTLPSSEVDKMAEIVMKLSGMGEEKKA